jgi:hypothetical protein
MSEKKVYLDIKVTTWKRIHFSEKVNVDEIKQLLIENCEDEIYDENLGFSEVENLFETDEDLSVEDNMEFSTKELYINGEIIWQNGK